MSHLITGGRSLPQYQIKSQIFHSSRSFHIFNSFVEILSGEYSSFLVEFPLLSFGFSVTCERLIQTSPVLEAFHVALTDICAGFSVYFTVDYCNVVNLTFIIYCGVAILKILQCAVVVHLYSSSPILQETFLLCYILNCGLDTCNATLFI